jgi:hypothetical protein
MVHAHQRRRMSLLRVIDSGFREAVSRRRSRGVMHPRDCAQGAIELGDQTIQHAPF